MNLETNYTFLCKHLCRAYSLYEILEELLINMKKY